MEMSPRTLRFLRELTGAERLPPDVAEKRLEMAKRILADIAKSADEAVRRLALKRA